MSLAIGWWDERSQTHRLMTDRRIVCGAQIMQPRSKIVGFSTANAFEAVALVGDQRLYQLCAMQRGAYISERLDRLREAIQEEGWNSVSKTGAPSWNLAGLVVSHQYTQDTTLYTMDGSFATTKVPRTHSMAFVGSGAEIGRAILLDRMRDAKDGGLLLDQIALRAMRVASELRTDVGDGVALWVSGEPGVWEFPELLDCELHLLKDTK